MPTITYTGAAADGNKWTTPGNWDLARAPLNTDDVVIPKNKTVVLDATTCVALSVTGQVGTTGVDTGAKLSALTTANTKLVIQQGLSFPSSTGGGGTYSTTMDINMSSAPSYTCELVTNNVNAAGNGHGLTINGNSNIRGAQKKRHTTLSSSVSVGGTTATVADATGWLPGDAIIFASTSAYNSTPRIDILELGSTYTPGSTSLVFAASPNTAINPGTVASFAYAHAAGCIVGNLRSNVIIRPGTAGGITFVRLQLGSLRQSQNYYFDDVELRSFTAGGSFPSGTLIFDQCTFTSSYSNSVSRNSFYDCRTGGMYISGGTACTRQDNIFHGVTSGSSWALQSVEIAAAPATIGPEVRPAVFQFARGINCGCIGHNPESPRISGITGGAGGTSGALLLSYNNTSCYDPWIWSSSAGFTLYGSPTIIGAKLGESAFSSGNVTEAFRLGSVDATIIDSYMPTTGTLIGGMSSSIPNTRLRLKNKSADPAVQEIYAYHSASIPVIQRDGSPANGARSTSALLMTLNSADAMTHSFDVLAKAGETITIIGYVRKSGTPSYGASTLPSITVSGLGITPVVATMSGGTAADTWEKLTATATNSGSSDGLLTVTLTAQSATAGAKAWFGGIPVAPFVSRVRHYGYQFNETSATRLVDALASASEATAASYTGMIITWGTSASSIAITTSQTFQKLYDYHQSQAVLNVGSALALTGAGVAGSPALFASGNITISDGAALNGAGTLSLGSYTLATEFSGGSNYSYTGGLWAQLESTPTFSGGTLTLGSEGVYTFTVGASMIITFAPSANDVTYDLSEVVVSGTLDLRNTHGTRPMIVQLASGVSYTTANNTGAAITVSLPTVNQEVTISGLSNTMRIQIYDESTIAPAGSRELYNGIPGTSSYTWTDSIAAVASRDIRLRVTETDMTPGVPIIMIDQTIGTCGTAEGTEAISFTVAETIDSVYEANNIDGSTITGITITDSTLRMEIDSGTVTTVDGVNVVLINVKNLYAYETYWLGTEEGIRDEARFINATDPANYGFVSFKLRNDTAYPVGIVGGYVKDVATDSCFSLPDYSGGPINFLPDHVVNNIVTITGGNVITGDISDVPTVAEIVAGVVSDSDTLTVGKFVALS